MAEIFYISNFPNKLLPHYIKTHHKALFEYLGVDRTVYSGIEFFECSKRGHSAILANVGLAEIKLKFNELIKISCIQISFLKWDSQFMLRL